MGRWVISPFISEEHVKILYHESLLKDFASCSKPVILNGIISYIQGEGDEEVKAMLREAYGDRISFLEVLQDTSVNENIAKVSSYSYSSVRPSLSIEELEEMRDTIKSVYNDDMNIPYINVIPGDIISGIINNILALYRVNANSEYKRLAYILSKNKELFKDKPNASAKGTIFKSISRRSSELDIILRGIDFLIGRLREDKQPESWRMF